MDQTRQLNALGFAIGSDGDQAMMVLARDKGGRAVSIEDVDGGKSCNCFCLDCGSPVIAKKGSVYAHHFAHESADLCAGSETQTHLFAKRAISIVGAIHLPSIETYGKIDEDRFVFERIESETRYSHLRPDLTAYYRSRVLLIEVRVTHAIPRAKERWLEETKTSCVEIDLRKFRTKPDADLVDAIIRKAPRRWVSHRTKSVPEPPPPITKITPSGVSALNRRPQSNLAYYLEQTAKDFPDLKGSFEELNRKYPPKIYHHQ